MTDPVLDALDLLERNAATNILSGSSNSKAAATVREFVTNSILVSEAQSVMDEYMSNIFGKLLEVFEDADEEDSAQDIREDVLLALGIRESNE